MLREKGPIAQGLKAWNPNNNHDLLTKDLGIEKQLFKKIDAKASTRNDRSENLFFLQHLVEGLLNFRRRVCRSFWLDLAFQDPPWKTDQ